jgi:hypothetical protein
LKDYVHEERSSYSIPLIIHAKNGKEAHKQSKPWIIQDILWLALALNKELLNLKFDLVFLLINIP